MKKTEDYIVVKDWKTAEGLLQKPIPSLAGKYIIVAPKGLKFVSKEDIARLPQVKELLTHALAEREEVAVDGAIEFMKGKIIDMPVGSGMPLVIKEGFAKKAILSHLQETEKV